MTPDMLSVPILSLLFSNHFDFLIVDHGKISFKVSQREVPLLLYRDTDVQFVIKKCIIWLCLVFHYTGLQFLKIQLNLKKGHEK